MNDGWLLYGVIIVGAGAGSLDAGSRSRTQSPAGPRVQRRSTPECTIPCIAWISQPIRDRCQHSDLAARLGVIIDPHADEVIGSRSAVQQSLPCPLTVNSGDIEMRTKYLTLLAMSSLAASGAYAAGTAGCDEKLMLSLQQAERFVGTLHPDKPGQARVLASDGTAFTGGEVLWMQGQLRRIAKACAHGNATDAAQRLAEMQKLIGEHRRSAS